MHFPYQSIRTATALRISLILLLVWLPLPLGSNRGWSAALFVMAIAALTLFYCLGSLNRGKVKARSKVQGSSYKAKPRRDESRPTPYPVGRVSTRHTAPGPTQGSTLKKLLVPRTLSLAPETIMLALLAATQCWVAIQWLTGTSADHSQTFFYLLLGTAYTLLFWLTLELFRDRAWLSALITALVISGTFQAFYGTFMTLSGTEWLLFGPKEYGKGVVTGTFVNRNHLAGYLEMTIACGIGLMLAHRSRERWSWRHFVDVLLSPKTRVRLALAIMVIALVMSRSRMGNTAFFASLIIGGALFILAHRENRLRNCLVLASLLAIDVLIISQYFGLENLKNRLVQTQLEDKIVAGEVVRRENVDRDDVAAYVTSMVQERPLTGFGAGSFEAAFPRFAGPDIPRDFDHAHNDYLQFIAEFGLIGTLPLALFVIVALLSALKALWHQQSLYRSGLGLGATMGISAILIHSATDFNLQIPANAATFVCLCAIARLANTTTRKVGLKADLQG